MVGSTYYLTRRDTGFYKYLINQSCRFNDDDSAHMTRTAGVPTNSDIATFSTWIKRANLIAGNMPIFQSYFSANDWAWLIVDTNGRLAFYQYDAPADYGKVWTPQYRDPTSWYHVLLVLDSSNATAADRQKLFVNGAQITDVTTDSGDLPLNQDLYFNINGAPLSIGKNTINTLYLDGYLAETNFIDGQALTPTSFGEFKNNIWIPIEYTETYGDNGFYLDYSNSSDFGSDQSGNSNDFTDVNLATNDQVLDSPTDNYPTLNPIHHLSTATLTNGNLECSGAENEYGTRALNTGKWSWLITVNENGSFGMEATDGTEEVAADVSGESVEMLADLVNGTLKKKVDGGGLETIEASLDLTKDWYPHFKAACAVDFGQLGHTSSEAGYKTLASSNMTNPTITDSSDGCVTDSDTGANIATTLAALRSGWGSYIDIYKNLSNIESWDVIFSDDSANSLHFDANDAKGAKQSLAAGDTYSGVSLRVGTAYGIFTDEVSHTNGADTDTAHSLGSADVGIVKLTDIAGSWHMDHPGLTASRNIVIDTNAAESATVYCTIDDTNVTVKSAAPTGTYRIIAFREVPGFSKFDIHTGNANANGPYSDYGGRMAVGMYKNTDDTDSWLWFTDERLGYNVDNNDLNPDTDAVEGTADMIDICSQGMKVRINNAEINANTEVYISLVWMAQPGKYSNSR
jgi:hypothetical protein